ncbi:MAG: prevent-host-death protein [Muribaculaceae bacterium]|nr:prevent-host-death protein [Muribaculaceae bacterium]
MEIVSARTFRANQTNILAKALRGESVLLSSRLGMFKITPVTENDTLTTRICEGLKEVKMIESGTLPVKSARSFLDEL